jgi:deoxyribonuclease (pyrimidine dimer)
LAERREIPRVITLAKKCDVPKDYRMGSGHVMFFYDKLGYILGRIIELNKECIARGFKPLESDYIWFMESQVKAKSKLNNEWKPSEKDIEINLGRLKERYSEKPHFYRMLGKNIDYLKFIENEKDNLSCL